MSFLLDTNVLSEFTRPRPDPNVLSWFDSLDEDAAFVSVVTIAELRRGAALMERGGRRTALEAWLQEDIGARFEERILDVTPRIANAWGDLMAGAQRRGIGLQAMDGFIAASAQIHSLSVATRNERDFRSLDIAVFNPWSLGNV